MPQRYESRTQHSTLSLNDAKRRMTKNMKVKYRGADAEKPQVRIAASEAYNGLVGKLSSVISALNEINAQLELSGKSNAAWASKAVDRYISATSSTKERIAGLNEYLDRHKAALSNMSPIERDEINGMSAHLQKIFLNIIGILKTMTPSKQRAIKGVFSAFVNDLMRMDQHLSSILAVPATLTGFPATPDAPRRSTVAAQMTADGETDDTDDMDRPVRRGQRQGTNYSEGQFTGMQGRGMDMEGGKRLLDQSFTPREAINFFKHEIPDALTGGLSRDRIGSNPNTWSPQTYGHFNRLVGGDVGMPNAYDYIPTRFL